MAQPVARIEVDRVAMGRFRSQVERFARESGKGNHEAMRQVMRGVVMNVSSWTPPRQKEQGEKTASIDVQRAVAHRPGHIISAMLKSSKALDPKPSRNPSEILQAHKSARDNRGRVPKNWKAKLVTDEHVVKNLVLQTLEHVGRLKAGWNAGAVLFKCKVAGFAWRHGTKEGSATDMMKDDGTGYLEIVNKVPYVGRHADVVKKAMDVARRVTAEKLAGNMKRTAAKFNRS